MPRRTITWGSPTLSCGGSRKRCASFDKALLLKPEYAEAHNNLGNVLRSLKLYDLALQHYDRAVLHKPDYAEAYSNRGNTLTDLDRAAEAIESFQASLRLNPNNPEAYNNLGTAFARLEELDQAIECYSKAAGLRNDYADAYFNRSVIRLQKGDFENGWAEYEWRWWTNGLKPRVYAAPPWNGESLNGKTLLIYTEQGAGDAFQFIRFLLPVKRLGAQVVLECGTDFTKILSTAPGVDQIVPPGALPAHFDYHCAMLSLPRVLKADIETIPRDVPYLRADPRIVASWRERFAGVSGMKVGIHWQGNPQYKGDRWRSIPLARFAPLAEVPGVRLISLQKNHGIDQIEGLGGLFEFEHIGDQLDNGTGAFVETAAVLANLDLLITSDTAIAHLAGRWTCRSGCRFRESATGAGSRSAKTRRGIRPCGYSGRRRRGIGTGSSRGSPPSLNRWSPSEPAAARCRSRFLPAS